MSRRRPEGAKNPSQTPFWRARIENTESWLKYFDRLTSAYMSLGEFKKLPDEVDERFAMLGMFYDGYILFFKDDVLEQYMALRAALGGRWSVYDIPSDRQAYASNGYQNDLNEENSVIIYDNLLHTRPAFVIQEFAERLANLDRIIDINANAQKTPILLRCDDRDRLTLTNVYKKYDGNAPVIYGDKGMSPELIQAISTGAPYVADKLYELKSQIWNEALTFMGIPNVTDTKNERLIRDEVNRSQGGVIAMRQSRKKSINEACEQINRMFGLDMSWDYNEEYTESPDPDGGQGSTIQNINSLIRQINEDNAKAGEGAE